MLTAAEMTFDSDSVYKLTLIIITPTVYYAIATSFCCKFTPACTPNAIWSCANRCTPCRPQSDQAVHGNLNNSPITTTRAHSRSRLPSTPQCNTFTPPHHLHHQHLLLKFWFPDRDPLALHIHICINERLRAEERRELWAQRWPKQPIPWQMQRCNQEDNRIDDCWQRYWPHSCSIEKFRLIHLLTLDRRSKWALAIRTIGCLHAEKIIDYLCDPLQKCLQDENPYVRKTAALCV